MPQVRWARSFITGCLEAITDGQVQIAKQFVLDPHTIPEDKPFYVNLSHCQLKLAMFMLRKRLCSNGCVSITRVE